MINKKSSDTKISFNDLAKYSNLPMELISNYSLKIRKKSKSEVLREYELEKWNSIYKKTKKLKYPTIEKVESLYQDLDEVTPYFYDNSFLLSKNLNLNKYHLELYYHFLKPFIPEASSVIELGAGYGSKIIGLSNFKEVKKKPLFGFELSANGCKTMDLLSKSLDLNLTTGYCDLEDMNIDSNMVPEGSIIFTSYSLHYTSNMSVKLIDCINRLKPKVVIHFEPIYELFSENTIHNLICRKYFEANDYTKNILSVLNKAEESKKINLKVIKPNILGSNPLLPISVIIWEPNNFYDSI